jgi:hypothetical protein
LFSPAGEDFYSFDQERLFLFGYARVALLEGLRALGIKQGDNVLLPSFVCNVILAPFNYLGIKVKYFEVDENLEPKIDQIDSLIDEKTKAILAVNYFGFPTLLNEIKDICHQKRLFFIEDNAHGLLSRTNDRFLGTFGDIAIFSIRKTLPVPNGAALLVNNLSIKIEESLINNMDASRKEKSYLLFLLQQIKRRFELHTGVNPMHIFKGLLGIKDPTLLSEESPEEERNIERYFVEYSKLTGWVVERLDFEQEMRIRREGFNFCLKNLTYGRPVFEDLPKGVAPYVFPVRVEDPAGFIDHMMKKGIQCFTWPTLPSDVRECPDFYKEIACIPLWRKYAN